MKKKKKLSDSEKDYKEREDYRIRCESEEIQADWKKDGRKKVH